jgi:RimJ/RimL family protein N-acetyltransferase
MGSSQSDRFGSSEDSPLIRRAQERDVPAIAAGHLATWQTAFRGLLPDNVLDGLTVEPFEQSWTLHVQRPSRTNFVSELAGQLTGFVSVGPSRDEDATPEIAEVYACYLFPGFWGSGHATLLWDAGLAALGPQFHKVTLWVFSENLRARRFYEKMGMSPDGAVSDRPYFGASASQLRYCLALPLA